MSDVPRRTKNGLLGFVTVRMSSSRLPAKCLLPFRDGNVLNHIVRRAFAFGIKPISSSPAPPVRLTLDYQADYWPLESVRRIAGNLASRKEINALFTRNPDLYKINLVPQ